MYVHICYVMYQRLASSVYVCRRASSIVGRAPRVTAQIPINLHTCTRARRHESQVQHTYAQIPTQANQRVHYIKMSCSFGSCWYTREQYEESEEKTH